VSSVFVIYLLKIYMLTSSLLFSEQSLVGLPPPSGGSPKFFSHNNGSVQMPPRLPDFMMGSYYYHRCCNLAVANACIGLRRGVGVGPKSSVRKIS